MYKTFTNMTQPEINVGRLRGRRLLPASDPGQRPRRGPETIHRRDHVPHRGAHSRELSRGVCRASDVEGTVSSKIT